MNDNYRKRNTFEVLLVFKIAIDRDQKIECSRRAAEHRAVSDAGPADLSNCPDFMVVNIVAQCARDALVKQHSHRQSG